MGDGLNVRAYNFPIDLAPNGILHTHRRIHYWILLKQIMIVITVFRMIWHQTELVQN